MFIELKNYTGASLVFGQILSLPIPNLKQQPGYEEALVGKAVSLIYLHDYKTALNLLNAAIKERPTNPSAYNNLVAGRQHTFAVRAVDTQGNKDPNPATFTWTVLTPTQATQKLIGTIDSFHLPRGVTTSLSAPLNAAIAQLNRNNHIAACNQLTAFLNQVSQKQTTGQLTPQQAADLRQQAIAIQHAIGCRSVGLAGLVGSSSGDEEEGEDLPLPMP